MWSSMSYIERVNLCGPIHPLHRDGTEISLGTGDLHGTDQASTFIPGWVLSEYLVTDTSLASERRMVGFYKDMALCRKDKLRSALAISISVSTLIIKLPAAVFV
jgi:hypothetical protein